MILSDRFWGYVDICEPGECWEWHGYINKGRGGYGNFKYATNDTRQAHRVAWELTNGPVPKGMCVCHHCDNPPCCNPNHLFLGTNQDNSDDMVSKNRSARGETHPATILTEKQVLEIIASPLHPRTLAKQYGINRTTAYNIKARRKWKHLTILPESETLH